MNISEIKKLKKEDLDKELLKMQGELEQTKFDIDSGKEKNVRKALRIRRNIARIQTILNQQKENNEKGRKKEK